MSRPRVQETLIILADARKMKNNIKPKNQMNTELLTRLFGCDKLLTAKKY